jgi:two-component system, chemotaxis family, CheB/CheR fusion protein
MSKTRPVAPIIKSSNHFPVVGIGASAGGLDAFKKLLKAIPHNSGMAYVLVQHLDPKHESLLPELLQKVTSIPVLEISDDIKVQPNHIYIIPSNKMMVANDGVLLLSPRTTTKNERNLPIDLFFTSLAEVHQWHSIGIVLSGTASDGTKGLKAIKDHGGLTFAQSEESSAFDGMPKSAIQAGVVDFILAPELIPQKLLEVTKITNGNGAAEEIPMQDEELFKQILALLRIRKGTDFTYYKQTTIRRRILRRMALNRNEELADYLKFLRANKTEQDVLYQDLLIPVTSFFRDAKTFDNLCQTVFPKIIEHKKADEPIRIWIAGCSTGQEAYSMAICIKEFLASSSSLSFVAGPDKIGSEGRGELPPTLSFVADPDKIGSEGRGELPPTLSFGEGRGELPPILSFGEGRGEVQIFATDISEPAIAKARGGIYAKNELDGLSPARLQENFIKNNGGYQVKRQLRDMCVFAQHNFLKDPPFGKLDLISCRNVLIYMEPYLQKKVLTTFHYALNHDGFLVLGKSETISSVPELFAPGLVKNSASIKDKIFSRKDAPAKYMHTTTQRSELGMADVNINPKKNADNTARPDFQKTADNIMLSKYTPAGVVVNEAMDVVHFRGKTGNYLENLPGKPSHNLLKMAKEGLAFELRNILHKAKKEKGQVTKENIPVQINGTLQNISIEAFPLPDTIEPYYMILFHENQPPLNQSSQITVQNSSLTFQGSLLTDQRRIRQLEKELEQVREDMRSITEDQEAVNEELQSANEELLSSSEELQSLNEELETGKEELQSTNEELTVVNQEMIGLNEQLNEAKNYAETIIATLREPLLVLDKYLRIISANKSFFRAFQVTELETEGKLIYELGNKQWDIPELKTLLENLLPNKQSFTDFEVSFNFPHIGQHTMLLNASEIINEKRTDKLILISFGDITERRIIEKKILTNEQRFRNLLLQSPFAVALCKGEDMVIDLANDAMKDVWGKGKNVEGKSIFKLLEKASLKPYKKLLLDVYHTGEAYFGMEQMALMKRKGGLTETYYNFVYQPYHEADGIISGIVCIAYEVTEQVLAKVKIQESEQQFSSMADNINQLAWMADNTGHIYWYNKRWYDYTGTTLEEMKGWGWQKVHHPDYVDGVINFVKEAWTKNKPFELTFPLRSATGEYKWFLTRAQPIANAKGAVIQWFGTNTDITEQRENYKKLEDSETFNRTMLENSPDCVKIIDTHGHIQFMNTNGLCIMEIDDFGTVKNKHWADLWGAENRQTVLNAIDKALSGETAQFQAFCATVKGTPRWWDVMVSPVQETGNEKVTNIISVSRDITAQRETQSLLEYRKALLEAHNEASIDGLLLVDAKARPDGSVGRGKIISYNKRFIEIWNMPQQIVNANDDEAALAFAMTQLVNPEQFIEKVKWLYEHPAETSRDILEFKDGKIVERHGYPVISADGSYYAWSWTFRDITEVKKADRVLRESEKNFRQLAELMPDKITTTNPDGHATYFNQNWVDYTGFTAEELTGQGWQKIMHPDEMETIIKHWQHSLETGEDFEMEMQCLNKNNEYHWHLTRATAIKDAEGKIKNWIGATTEIQKIKEEEQRKGEFIAMVSHELKTPVTSIKGYVQFLLSMLKDKPDAALAGLPLQSSLTRIDSQVLRLTRLIKEMLDLTRLETGKLELKKELFSVNKMVEETVQDIMFTNSKHVIHIHPEFNGMVSGDEDRIGQVLINFINNALKYSGDHNPVDIYIRQAAEDLISVSVKDYGIGIRKADHQKIFERFYRVDGKSEQTYAGFGIGLYIAKEIIDRHQGFISVESEKGKGSAFTFTLPLATEKF